MQDFYLEEWRLNAFTIVKYITEGYNHNGNYIFDEWTSYSDICKVYDGSVLTKDIYLLFEERYIKAARLFLEFVNAENFVLSDLNKYSTKKTFKKKDDLVLWNAYESLKNNEVFNVIQLPEIIKIVLREYAQLSIIINDNFNSTIHFGFDYYMYFDSKKKFVMTNVPN